MDKRPIGVFDSGLGGLTAVRELMRILPGEDILYFGDTGRVPYGTRGRDTILRYAEQDVRFLMQHDVKVVLAACGTVSSVAHSVGDTLPVPFVDVLRPTAKAAAEATKNRRVGIIGTSATIASGSYKRELLQIDGNIMAFEQACPLFVPLVENGFVSPQETVTRLVAERYLAPLKDAGVDTLILGCTHYPIISEIVQQVMCGGVTLIDSGREAAAECRRLLAENRSLNENSGSGRHHYYVSDMTESFYQVASLCLGQDVHGEVEKIDIEKF